MSEPVSNVEIEDVLSSIRRLVSEENRPTARRDSDDTPRKPSRLVLTPSLLVPVPDTVEPPADSADESPDDQPQAPESDADIPESAPTPQEVTETAGDDTQEVDWDQADAPADDQDDFVEASDADSDALLDLSEFEADPDADTDFAAELESESEVESEGDSEAEPEIEVEAEGAAEAEPEPDTGQDTDPAPAPWRDRETTLYEAAQSTPDLAIPDLAFLPSAQDEQPQTDASANDDTTSDEQHHTDTVEDVQEQIAPDDDAQPTDPDPLNTATLSAKIAVLEAKIGETQDQWEPDGETDDDYAGTPVETIQWQDHTDEEVDETPDPAVEPEIAVAPQPQATADVQVDEPVDFLPEDETILDEEGLRELVADIVRQELQGALGERITRNVRKLVRREIHRALTAQELD
jgi:hypothetical protein